MITKDEIKPILKEKVLTVLFKKKDGTRREMICTLKNDLLPIVEQDPNKPKKAENPDVLPVWDLENKAFRSFRLDSIISYSLADEAAYEL